MKKYKKIIILLGVMLSILSLTGCNIKIGNPSQPETETVTVTTFQTLGTTAPEENDDWKTATFETSSSFEFDDTPVLEQTTVNSEENMVISTEASIESIEIEQETVETTIETAPMQTLPPITLTESTTVNVDVANEASFTATVISTENNQIKIKPDSNTLECITSSIMILITDNTNIKEGDSLSIIYNGEIDKDNYDYPAIVASTVIVNEQDLPAWMTIHEEICSVHRIYEDHISVKLLQRYDVYDAGTIVELFFDDFNDIVKKCERSTNILVKFADSDFDGENLTLNAREVEIYEGNIVDINKDTMFTFKGYVKSFNDTCAIVTYNRGDLKDLEEGTEIIVLYPNFKNMVQENDYIKIYFSEEFIYDDPYVITAETVELS